MVGDVVLVITVPSRPYLGVVLQADAMGVYVRSLHIEMRGWEHCDDVQPVRPLLDRLLEARW
jgi:hypothetical protein